MNPWDHSAPGWGQIPPGYSQPEPAHGGYWQQPAWTEPKEGFFHSTSTSLAMRSQPANKKMRRLSQDLTSVLHWLLADRFTSKSRRYPSLHPILAADTTQARVDVRFHSSSGKAIPDATYYALGRSTLRPPATQSPATTCGARYIPPFKSRWPIRSGAPCHTTLPTPKKFRKPPNRGNPRSTKTRLSKGSIGSRTASSSADLRRTTILLKGG
jgi:hypothetical protein